MSIFSVILPNNQVRRIDYSNIGIFIKDLTHVTVIDNVGETIVNKGNPITWPTDAHNGLQAIVDVKAGTLRFGTAWGPRATTEYVVSEYCESDVHKEFTSIEDAQPSSRVSILDSIKVWPAPVRDLKLTDIYVDGVKWDWVWQFGSWAITDGKTTYEKDGWSDYCDDHKPKSGIHSESSTVVWPEGTPEGTPDGHVVVHDNINGDIYVVAPDHEFKTNEDPICVKQTKTVVTAASMLTAALGQMEDRAKTYDAPGGERSMGKTVSAFNTITGLQLSEEQGWLFMEILKQVRSQQGNYRADNYEDMVAYAALRGECAARERKD